MRPAVRTDRDGWPARTGCGGGFTLVELLVVIGIITVLIGLLLAGLSNARREAKRVKCLASLHEIGHAFKLYDSAFKGAWPVAAHEKGAPPLLPEERRWSDLLAPFVGHTRGVESAADIEKVRRRSVLWGCPAWDKGAVYDPNSAYDGVRVGYAMQYEPVWTPNRVFVNAPDVAYVGSGFVGQYFKGTAWNARGSGGQRGVIGCSPNHVVAVPSKLYRSAAQWIPFKTNGLLLDATRHLSRRTPAAASAGQRGLNMLFADGSARPVSIVEAWNALRCPGTDMSEP